MMRRDLAIAGLGFWLLVAVFLAMIGGRARAQAAAAAPIPAAPAATWGQFHGQVVFSDVLIAAPAQFPTPAAMTEALQRLKRTTVQGSDGFWRLHMMAFLDPTPPSGALQLRATDVTDPQDPHEVRVFDIDGRPGDDELPISDLVLTSGMGFARGHRYELAVIPRASAPTSGKADVYAKGVITLM